MLQDQIKAWRCCSVIYMVTTIIRLRDIVELNGVTAPHNKRSDTLTKMSLVQSRWIDVTWPSEDEACLNNI
jgi:hypothetical protein